MECTSSPCLLIALALETEQEGTLAGKNMSTLDAQCRSL